MKTVKFVVTVRLPNDTNLTHFTNYIRIAMQTWKGSMNPECQIFNLKLRNNLTVKRIKT